MGFVPRFTALHICRTNLSNGWGRTWLSKRKLKEKIEAFRPRIQKLNKELAEIVIDKVTIGQAIGGATCAAS